MTFRSICIAVYVFFYLIFTTPMRARLKKLEKTDPQEASRIAQEQVQKVFMAFTWPFARSTTWI